MNILVQVGQKVDIRNLNKNEQNKTSFIIYRNERSLFL